MNQTVEIKFNRFNIIKLLFKHNFIEKIIEEPKCMRDRQKMMGFMWTGR